MELSSIINQVIAGMTRGSIFFLLASGLTLIFGVIKVINFAHGSLYMLSMYVLYSLTTPLFAASQFGFWLNIILAPIVVMVIGSMIEIFLLRRIYKEEHLMQFMVTFALAYIISDSVKVIWGVFPKSVSRPDILKGAIILGGGIFPIYNLFVIVAALIIMIGLWIFLYKTRFGFIARAAANDPETTSTLGINVSIVFTGIFAIGSFLAAFAGALNLPLTSAALGIDMEMVILAFVIVIIGGVGSIKGAVLAAFIVGLVEAFGVQYIPRLTILLIFFTMIIVLIVRPFGIFGRVTR